VIIKTLHLFGTVRRITMVDDDFLRVSTVPPPEKSVEPEPPLDPAVLAKAKAEWITRLWRQTRTTILMGFGLYIGAELIYNAEAAGAFIASLFPQKPPEPGVPPEAPAPAPSLDFALGIEHSDIAVVVTALVVLAATFSIAVIASDIPRHKDPVDRVNLHMWTSAATRIVTTAAAISLAAALSSIPDGIGLALVLIGAAGLTIWTAGTTQLRSDDQIPILLRGHEAWQLRELAKTGLSEVQAAICRDGKLRWWRLRARAVLLLALRGFYSGLLVIALFVVNIPLAQVASWSDIPGEIRGAWFQLIGVLLISALPAIILTAALGYIITFQKLHRRLECFGLWVAVCVHCGLWGLLAWASYSSRGEALGIAFGVEFGLVPLAVPLVPHFWAKLRGRSGSLAALKLTVAALEDVQKAAKLDFERTGLPESLFADQQDSEEDKLAKEASAITKH